MTDHVHPSRAEALADSELVVGDADDVAVDIDDADDDARRPGRAWPGAGHAG